LGTNFVIFWNKRIGKVLFSSVNSTTFAFFGPNFRYQKLGEKKGKKRKEKPCTGIMAKTPIFGGLLLVNIPS